MQFAFGFIFSLLFFFAALVPDYCGAKEFWQGPYFWREKDSVREKMIKERFIPVSVQRTDGVWSMKGAGKVQAPSEFVYKMARDFDRLRKQSDHFKKVEWSEEKKELEVVFRVISKDMKVRYKMTSERTEGPVRHMIWQVIEGKYTGAQTALLIEDAGSQECEVLFLSSYSGEISWMPDFMLSLAVEAVLHHVATSLRIKAENEWKESQNANGTTK